MAQLSTILLVLVLVTMVTRTAFGVRSVRQDNGDSCRDSYGNVCANHGLCKNGVCQCNYPYEGRFCESPPVGSCMLTKACVQCSIYNSGSLSPEECHRCTRRGGPIRRIHVVEELDPSEDRHLCRFMDDDGCVLTYTTSLVGSRRQRRRRRRRYDVLVRATKECPRLG
ncbi:integrin beta-PS-like [Babylonia areolata]|uniref:integrin beta-PS-like n=1 Tax=Babylonia areolata TaxID=304850 RepID=UPI003FD2E9E9